MLTALTFCMGTVAVRKGGRIGCVLLSCTTFLIMAVYYVLKAVRESLILTQGGAEVKSCSAIAQVAVLLLILPVYDRLASRTSRLKLINGSIALFAMNLLVFAILDRVGARIGIIFFIWLGVFSVTLVTQVAAFANDLYNEELGKRILPVLGAAAAFGVLAGSQASARIQARWSTSAILSGGAVLLSICMALTRATDRYASAQSPAQREIAGQPVGGPGAFRIVLTKRYFALIAMLVVLINMGNATGEYMLSRMAVERANMASVAYGGAPAVKREWIGAFYGSYFAWAGVAGLLLQLLVVPRLLPRLGAARSLAIEAGVSAIGYSCMTLMPGLPVAQAVKVAENSLDYTLGRTSLNALFLRTSRPAKYKAKTVIDTLCFRGGDLLQGLLVMGGTKLAFGIREFAAVNVVLALASAYLAYTIHVESSRHQAPAPTALHPCEV